MTTQHAVRLEPDPFANAAIDAEALEVVLLLLSGSATVADGAAIGAWRAQSAVHGATLDEAIRVWRGLASAARASTDAEAPPPARVVERTASNERRLQGRSPAASSARRGAPAAKKSPAALREGPPRSV